MERLCPEKGRETKKVCLGIIMPVELRAVMRAVMTKIEQSDPVEQGQTSLA
jgi:hypothetical protein